MFHMFHQQLIINSHGKIMRKPLDFLGVQVLGTGPLLHLSSADREELLGAAAVHHGAAGTDLGGA